MHKFERIVAFTVCFAIIISMATTVFAKESADDKSTEVYEMTTNDNVNPIGIDTLPKFSWKMVSDVIGQKQTAYRIVVKDNDNTVWDSGKVQSDNTVAVEYAGQALKSSTEYTWELTVWDKNGDTVTDTATFETGLLEKTAWDGTEWISVDGGVAGYSNDALDYTIETDLFITQHGSNNNACIYFNKADDYNYFMWQIKYTPADGLVKLRPHVKLGGSYSVLTTSDVTAYVKDIDNIYMAAQSLKINVTKSGVVTYFNGQKVSEFSASDLKIAISDKIEEFGIRAHGETTVADSFRVTDNSTGTVILDTDFSDNRVYFENTTVADGKATLVSKSGEKLSALAGFIPSQSFGNANYTIETDFTVMQSGKATRFSVIFNGLNAKNCYMWQFAADMTNKKLTLTPHVRNLGSWKKPVGSIDVTSYINCDISEILETPQKLKIQVENGGVNTYLNGTLVSTVEKSKLTHFPLLNYIAKTGARVYSEKGALDNYRITDYSTDKNGRVLCDYNFDDGVNVFEGGTAENGGITFVNMDGEAIWFMKKGACELRYSVSCDITVEKQAIGIIFGATDSRNGYMWQFYKNSDGTVSVKPHSLVNGAFGAYSDYTVKVDVGDISTTPANVRVDVTPYTLTTYVDGTFVHTIPVGIKNAKGGVGIAPVLGRVGVRASSGESGTLDSIKVVDYTQKANGKTAFDCDFSSGNPFLAGEVKNGALYINNVGAVFLNDRGSHFYKKFRTDKPVSAKLYTTGSGIYNVFVNGIRVGNDELKPAFTDARARRFYHSFDVTGLVNAGDNIISAISTGGWWTDAIVQNVGKKPAFRAKMMLTYKDGSQTVIGTDTTWQADFDSSVVYADIYTGEVYDSTVTPSYSGANAVVNTEFSGVIEAYKGSPLRVRDDLQKEVVSATVYEGVVGAADDRYGKINTVATYTDGSFTLKKGQTAVVDFGQNLAGWEAFTVSGARGTTVTVRHAETVNDGEGLISRGNDGPEGSVYTANLRSSKAATVYTLSGEESEYYRPSYTYYGFRYIEITATDDVTFSGICAQVLTSVEKDSGSITTSDADLNQLISNSIWGMYSNYVSVPTDCPQRDERAGWAGDTQVFSKTATYLSASSKAFLSKWLQDFRDNQAADGQYAGAAPTCKNGKNYGALGWADAGIIVPYNIYKMYGDTSLIKEHYASMQLYVDGFLSTTGKTGPKHTYGDWLSIEQNAGDVKRILGVAYYAWDALMMAEMADAIGKTEDAERYRALYQTEKDYFIEQFVLEDGSLCDSRQTSCIYALYFDLLPDENSVEKVTKQLVDNIEAAGNKLQTGFLGTPFILPALTKVGRSDIAYKILLQHDYPSWLYTVDNGATTMWERWNSYTLEDGFGEVSMNSFNHYAYGAVTEWLFADMAGIKANDAFSNFVLSPVPDRALDFVSAEYDSANGLIKSGWEYDGDAWKYRATVPANTTATVKIPADSMSGVYVNGSRYNEVTTENDGIEFVGYADGVAEFRAVASTFEIVTGAVPEIIAKDCNATLTFDARRVYWGYIGTENTEYKWFNDFKAQCGDTFTSEFDPKACDKYLLEKAGYYRFVVNYIDDNGKSVDRVFTFESGGQDVAVPAVTVDGNYAVIATDGADVNKLYYGYIGETETAYAGFDRSVLTEADFSVKDGDTYLLNKAGYYRFVVNYKQGDRLVDKVYTVKVEKDGGVPDVTYADGKIKLSTNGVKVNKLYLAYNGEGAVEVTSWTDYCEKAIARACYLTPSDESEYTLANSGCYTVLVNYFDGNKNVDKYFTINN